RTLLKCGSEPGPGSAGTVLSAHEFRSPRQRDRLDGGDFERRVLWKYVLEKCGKVKREKRRTASGNAGRSIESLNYGKSFGNRGIAGKGENHQQIPRQAIHR